MGVGLLDPDFESVDFFVDGLDDSFRVVAKIGEVEGVAMDLVFFLAEDVEQFEASEVIVKQSEGRTLHFGTYTRRLVGPEVLRKRCWCESGDVFAARALGNCRAGGDAAWFRHERKAFGLFDRIFDWSVGCERGGEFCLFGRLGCAFDKTHDFGWESKGGV